jgi:hypothetical protein
MEMVCVSKQQEKEQAVAAKIIKIAVTLANGEGSGLLMNNPQGMFEKEGIRPSGKDYDVKKAAEKSAYKLADGTLYIPSEAISASMRGASSWVKVPRGTPPLRQLISGTLEIMPYQIPILDKTGKKQKKYEIDTRRVVIMHSAVAKARAFIPEWQAKFTISYNTAYCPHPPKTWKTVLDLAGHVVGILDYRPQHTGHFGKFDIVEWTVEET